MERYRTLWITERGLRHQQNALAAAPPELDVVVLRHPDRAELLAALAPAEFLISERSGVVDAEMIAAAPRLRMILRLGSLAFDIDLAAARRAGVIVCTWPVRAVIMVAEHAMLQMLALSRRLRELEAIALGTASWGPSRRTDENTFAYNWSARLGIEGLWHKTVGILGFGEIGAELARRLSGWECRVLYFRRHRLPLDEEARLGVTYAPRDELLSTAGFVVNLLPYAHETDHSLAAAEFARMKPGAMLASCGSGSVIDEAALAEALASGHLGGAALDTFEWEPLTEDNPLRRLAIADPGANVLLTPHIGAGAPATGTIPPRDVDYVPILRFLRGEPLSYRLV